MAGTTGQTVSYPFDLMRRRFQLQTMAESTVTYTSIPGAFVHTVKTEGVLGLFKGYLPNFVKTWPTIAIMFWANDMLKQSAAYPLAFGRLVAWLCTQ